MREIAVVHNQIVTTHYSKGDHLNGRLFFFPFLTKLFSIYYQKLANK